MEGTLKLWSKDFLGAEQLLQKLLTHTLNTEQNRTEQNNTDNTDLRSLTPFRDLISALYTYRRPKSRLLLTRNSFRVLNARAPRILYSIK